jgi:membrane protein
LVLTLLSAELVGWARRGSGVGGVAALVAYLVIVGMAWLFVSVKLPHGDVTWHALLPGAFLVGVGLLSVNAFNVYVTARMVDNQANTYGALGIAAALLFSLVLVGRVIVVSAELNASLAERSKSRRP